MIGYMISMIIVITMLNHSFTDFWKNYLVNIKFS